ncbi:BlaI/MecI/CopY family transcriptional regulator [Undibacterium crateris]|uniref:BlaI/MecI/CopY family transcriptional regulator n=1 Tax=Undibacterium crateris TaxID=2528175 RepID=UPI0013899885|nr:BlaI/MecI/CopY family transcriptional regulator [Undibacterium crateris]NDI87331.1 BlaI/MecI/CopY family transcriptional regulator [Undibacterium crateris]
MYPTEISDAEALIMQLLWAQHPQSAEQLCAALCTAQGWQPATVKTLLNRLLKKNAIRAEKESRYFLYSPVLKQEKWVASESKGFLQRVFDGQLAPMVAHFSQSKQLSKTDIAELKKLIQDLENER